MNVNAGPAMALDAKTKTVSWERSAGSFEQLFQVEYPKVVAVANRVLNDPQEAEDVAQEVFLSFHRLHSPEAVYAPAWLHSAAAHRSLNRLRDLRRRREREARQAAEPVPTLGDPVALLEADETRRVVRRALTRLRSRYATVLALRYSGLSYAEVAAAMRVGVGQVGTLLRRAEAELKKEVERVPSP